MHLLGLPSSEYRISRDAGRVEAIPPEQSLPPRLHACECVKMTESGFMAYSFTTLPR